MAAIKVTISMESELLEKLDKYAEENCLTRSGFISLATKQYLEAASVLPSMTTLMKKLVSVVSKNSGLTDEQVKSELDQLEIDYNNLLGR